MHVDIFLSPESAAFVVASIQNQPAREWTDRLIQKGVAHDSSHAACIVCLGYIMQA